MINCTAKNIAENCIDNTFVVMNDGKITHVSEWPPAVEEESCNGDSILETKAITNGILAQHTYVIKEELWKNIKELIY